MSVGNRTVRLALLDYGAGNLHSLVKGLERSGPHVRVDVRTDAAALLDADGLVLPGVGAFGAAAERLAGARARIQAALEEGYPALGVCLGMQLLFETSEESPGEGLGVLPGHVRRLVTRRVPHMGWNTVCPLRPDPLLPGEPLVAYFANSFVAEPERQEDVVATTQYAGVEMPSVVRRANVWGVQFHPEKSGDAGLALLDAFVREVAAR
ncbi:MAG TPA: imidazole glycerol phosphate synthase subunit HisH [Longimicrobiales bacterium]|nr:imidazole glycerol phosphate synthase subunit HisH [Longimicrobiales bacterium]